MRLGVIVGRVGVFVVCEMVDLQTIYICWHPLVRVYYSSIMATYISTSIVKLKLVV